ncbi:MAG: FMN-binding protein [Planctomycetaceae bacterium]|nr:FMN-binding protein [Planctomycetaceae bacterium]
MHTYRLALFALILGLIHQQHHWYTAQLLGQEQGPLKFELVLPLYPEATALGEFNADSGGQLVLDAEAKPIGYVIQTSPEADTVIGFSGPTNTLVAFGMDQKILGIDVIRSGDTREHLRDVLRNEPFMTALNGLTAEQARQPQFDAVSGATLTSTAIMSGIALRLGGENPASRFPEEIDVAEARDFFPTAHTLAPHLRKPDLLNVLDVQQQLLGHVARTSPHADTMLGYQGPTDTLVALDPEMVFIGARIRHTYDNEPFVSYVRDDEYFFNTFKGFTAQDIAQLDMVDAGIEGVSSATKTSITIAESILLLTQRILAEPPSPVEAPRWQLAGRDLGTMLVVAAALVIALTHLRGNTALRLLFQVVLVGYLGFLNADMLSQALLVGWTRNGIAWANAPGLAVLSIAALCCPIFTGRQVYCTHLCPFGGLQDWLRRVPVRVKLPKLIDRLLRLIPGALLLLVMVVAMRHWEFSLVGIEPFDAFVWRIAGWSTLIIAIVGLLAATMIPMAYCHYGCPTGAMLNFLRINSVSGRFTRRDAFASIVALVGVVLLVVR